MSSIKWGRWCPKNECGKKVFYLHRNFDDGKFYQCCICKERYSYFDLTGKQSKGILAKIKQEEWKAKRKSKKHI